MDFPELADYLNAGKPAPPLVEKNGPITIYRDLVQGTDEWMAARRGLLTASEMHLIITPTLKVASNEKERMHLYELLAQRITGHTEPTYVNDAMIKGIDDEIEVRKLYSEHIAPVATAGFITNDEWGFRLGCSPDGLVGKDGLIEIKSRRQKFQVQTIIAGEVPAEFMIQVQTGILVTRRSWCDFISYCGGLPISPIRVFPDANIQAAIIEAATAFEEKMAAKLGEWHIAIASRRPLILTERRVEQDIRV